MEENVLFDVPLVWMNEPREEASIIGSPADDVVDGLTLACESLHVVQHLKLSMSDIAHLVPQYLDLEVGPGRHFRRLNSVQLVTKKSLLAGQTSRDSIYCMTFAKRTITPSSYSTLSVVDNFRCRGPKLL